MPGGRPKGSTNKRSQGILSLLKRDYDLDPILKLAELIQSEKPLVHEGEIVTDHEGKQVMVPVLDNKDMIAALGKLADKTYPALKAMDMNIGGDLPTVVINLRGVDEEVKPAPKKKPAARRSRTSKEAKT